jgi:L-fuculose-phosphate aldolase
MHREFIKAGRVLWEAGHIHYTAGNLSIRRGKSLWVTRTGAPLGFLAKNDIVRVDLHSTRRDRGASSETPVHRAIYRSLGAVGAVAHSHAPYATLVARTRSLIRPRGSDRLFLPAIPVLAGVRFEEGSAVVARRLPALLRRWPVAVVRGHGAFAVGKDLDQCIARLTMAEDQCRYLFLSGEAA